MGKVRLRPSMVTEIMARTSSANLTILFYISSGCNVYGKSLERMVEALLSCLRAAL
jgi:hypothetical protein